MDTRNKILTAEAALQVRPGMVVTAAFDVLRASHIKELRRLREAAATSTILAIVLPVDGEILPLQARMELAAALRMIDYVVTVEIGHLEAFLARLQPTTVVRWESADQARTRQLIEHVQRRQTQ